MKSFVNPIGSIKPMEQIQVLITKFEELWDQVQPSTGWKSWFSAGQNRLVKMTVFLINSLDEFVQEVEGFQGLTGPDKKATVLAAVSKLYDYIGATILPIYLKPFSGKIKSIIVNVIVSYAIDFFVEKYNDGSWKMPETQPVPVVTPVETKPEVVEVKEDKPSL